MKVALHPGAERDIQDAADFYAREGSAALAARFIAAVKRLLMLLMEQPHIGSSRSGGRRGLSMGVFPYTGVYRAGPLEIRILVVKHDKRRPGYGSTRT